MARVPVFTFIIILLVIILTSGGCGVVEENNSENGTTEITDQVLDPAESDIQEGYVVETNTARILVVSDIAKEEAFALTADKILEENGGGQAVWYAVKDVRNYKVGQLLRVKSEMMMESYPAQSEAVLVQIVEEP